MRDDAVLRRALPLGRGLGRRIIWVTTKLVPQRFSGSLLVTAKAVLVQAGYLHESKQ